jgi:hypothetical protein
MARRAKSRKQWKERLEEPRAADRNGEKSQELGYSSRKIRMEKS